MGAAATIEVSFIDQKTGKMLSDEKINELNEGAQEVLDSFDFSSDFYMAFARVDAYSQVAIYYEKESQVARPPWCFPTSSKNLDPK